MGMPLRLALSALVVLFPELAVGVAAQPLATTVTQLAAATTGTIEGQVLDERGQPLADVMVSAVGGGTTLAVSDREGQFSLRSLPPGPYLLRAHREGYIAARQSMVNVRPAARTVSSFTLRRASGSDDPQVLAAGAGSVAAIPAGRDDDETSWRLRHLKRSILRDSQGLVGLEADDDWFITDSLQLLGRAVNSSARLATSLFTDTPFQGQINLLTTGTFDSPGQLLQLQRPHAVAFFALGAPVGTHGDWTVNAALNQGDLSSWVVSGRYLTRNPATHRYQFGMSYGLHRYEGGNAAALAAIPESARNVGSVYAYDDWRVAPYLSVSYGAHYGHYDYLQRPALLSPRLSATITPLARTHIRAVASRRVAAPGAEEFLPPSRAQAIPPQRTFSPLSRDGFQPEDTTHYELALERVLDGVTLGVRAFHQSTSNQHVTLFGQRNDATQITEIGHYFVGAAGNVDVRGWGMTLTHALAEHVRGSFDYVLAEADWHGGRTLDRLRLVRSLPSALRPASERVHDLTSTLETEIPHSATRVFFIYKLNSGYVRADGSDGSPALDGRWDLQVSQGLPFMGFTSADWEMLVAIRNLYRDSFTETSIYDELLVASPPKRLVGGITVKF